MDLEIYSQHFTWKQQNIHSLSAHGTFPRTDHILGNKSAFNKYRKTEITTHIFSDNPRKPISKPEVKIQQDHKYVDVKEHPTKVQIG